MKYQIKQQTLNIAYYPVNDIFHVMQMKINFHENNKKKERNDETLWNHPSDTDDFIAVRNNVYIGKMNLNACSIASIRWTK